MPPDHTWPLVSEVCEDPAVDFPSEPLNVVGRIVPVGGLALLVGSPTHINNMQQHICVPQVIQELVSKTLIT